MTAWSAAATARAASATDTRRGRNRWVTHGASSSTVIHSPPIISSTPLKKTGLPVGRTAAIKVASAAVGPIHGIAAPIAATSGTTTVASHGLPLNSPPNQVKTVITALAASIARARAPYGPAGPANAT